MNTTTTAELPISSKGNFRDVRAPLQRHMPFYLEPLTDATMFLGRPSEEDASVPVIFQHIIVEDDVSEITKLWQLPRLIYAEGNDVMGGLEVIASSLSGTVALEFVNEQLIVWNDDPPIVSENLDRLPDSILERLNRFATLPENWDSYGAPPISQKIIDWAVSTLREILRIGKKEIPLPFIAPAGDGRIVMEWKTELGKELILDVPPNTEPLSFLLVEPTEDGGEIETEDVIGEDWTLEQIIKRLLAR